MIKHSERDFEKLNNSIRIRNRYIHDSEAKDIIGKIEEFFCNREIVVHQKVLLYRAQKGCDWDDVEYTPVPYCKDRMLPLKTVAREGRANPKGIPYIYLATELGIAICEVRSWPGDHVSVAIFTNLKELKMVDFSSDRENPLIIDFGKNELLSNNTMESMWADINKAFSRPVNNNDDTAEYALTQVIAECVKNKGYDGLIYNSGYIKSEQKGKNIVIFDETAIEIKYADVYSVKGISIDYSQETNTFHYSNSTIDGI